MKKRVLAAILCAAALFGFAGCEKTPPPASISGGTVDNTDENAPKVIESKDITDFYANFYLRDRWTASENHFFVFQVKPDENGVLTASEEKSGLSLPADGELLAALQEVIDRNDMAARNGVYRVTSGLPPEYQASNLKVVYASGEKLNCTVNNFPEADWAKDVYTVFADWFSARGYDSLYPEKEESRVTSLVLFFKKDGIYLEYLGINVGEDKAIDGETYLLEKSVYDDVKHETVYREFIRFPEDYYEKLTELLYPYDLSTKYDFSYFDHGSGYFGLGGDADGDEEDSEDLSLDLHIEYESGRRMNIETKKASEIAAMEELLTEITDYHDSLF